MEFVSVDLLCWKALLSYKLDDVERRIQARDL
jgi:hypothetical protein